MPAPIPIDARLRETIGILETARDHLSRLWIPSGDPTNLHEMHGLSDALFWLSDLLPAIAADAAKVPMARECAYCHSLMAADNSPVPTNHSCCSACYPQARAEAEGILAPIGQRVAEAKATPRP